MVDPGAQVDIKWTSWVGFDYQVKYSDDLVIWHDAPGGARSAGATAGEFTYSDTMAGGAPAKRYYRVIRWKQ